MQKENSAPAFTHLINLAAERFGAKVLWCTDDFFAEKENLIKPEKPIFIAEKFTEHGKWMDGWESRRKRTEGHDIVVIQLGAAGIIKGFDVDTSHFLGNQPEYCTIEACYAPNGDWENASWVEVLGKTMLKPGSQHFVDANPQPATRQLATHVRLHIHPDGGVARLRVYGEVQRDWKTVKPDELVDLASAQNGALAIQCNDMFFSHMNNLLMPGRGVNMGDGWETKRNRTPNNCDWVIVRLAHKGILKKALIDTAHFKGNYPDSFTLEGCSIETTAASTHRVDPQAEAAALANAKWRTLIKRTKLQAHHEHLYEKELVCKEAVSHVRLNIFPDGGVSRIRLWGTIV
ncbi:MAG: allantoicase [Flavobacteriales bacterium]|jgi:allantoicase|nr:allantoicase [Flavobacteriales bacterium]